MAHLSMNEMTTYRWSFEEDVQHYAAAGIPALAVWRQKLSDFGEEKGIELLRESGMAVSSLLWAGGFTGSDGRSHRDSIQDAREAIRVAAALKAGSLIVYSGARGGHTHNHARRLLKTALTQLTPFADEFGVTLAIEPMHDGCAGEWTFLTTLDETLEVLDQLGHPRLQLAFDCYHFGQQEGIVERLVQLASRIAIVQLGDGREPPCGEQNRCPLGQGSIPLREIVAALTAAGYAGYLDVELMGEEIEAVDYDDLLRRSKQFFDQLPA